jgi:DNA transposition AAA+ family ATPase
MTGSDFGDFLTERGQLLMAAWTLPNEGALTDTQRRQAMENFRQYISLHEIRVIDVGRQVGTPKATTIGELLKGVYRDKADVHVRTLNMWVEQHARQQAARLKSPFVETRVAKDILQAARLVRENRTMGLVVGPTGIGKTRCAQALHETIVGSIFLTIRCGAYHAKGLTTLLAETLSVRTVRSSRSELQHMTQFERVIARLEHSHRLLIIDEAHKLQAGAIELLREIHDMTGVPILLLAVKDLHDRIERSADPDHGQLYSRFDIIYTLTEGREQHAGGKPLYAIDEIRQLFQQVPIRLARDAADYLLDVANDLGRGSLRRCVSLLRNGVRRARKRQGKTEEDTVTVTADDLAYAEMRLKRSRADRDMAQERRRRLAAASA